MDNFFFFRILNLRLSKFLVYDIVRFQSPVSYPSLISSEIRLSKMSLWKQVYGLHPNVYFTDQTDQQMPDIIIDNNEKPKEPLKFYEHDVNLRKTGHGDAALLCIPRPLAVICLIFNIFLPGIGK